MGATLVTVLRIVLSLFTLGGIAWLVAQLPSAGRFRPILSELGALTTTAADAVLKEDYKEPVREQLNNANVILANLEKNSDDIVGRRAVLALHTGRNSGVGARPENGTLPSAGQQKYTDVFIPVRSNYARIQLTGQTIQVMAKDRGAFIRALRPEMDGAQNDAGRDMCRQVWGTSDGKIATCGTTTASTTVQLAATTTEVQLFQLEEGFLVDIGTLASPATVASARSIVSVDFTNLRVVISGAAVTTSGSHFLFRSGAGGASDNSGKMNDGQIELTGLQHIVDNASVLHTLDPAVEPRWKAEVYSNGGVARNISENLVMKGLMRSQRRAGKVAGLLVGSDGVYRAYGNLLSTLRRIVNDVDLSGGYSGLSITSARMGTKGKDNLTLTWDRDAPNGKLWGLDLDSITMYELADWEWMDDDGAVLNRVPNTDAFEATMKAYKELGCSRRNSQFVISDLSEV